MRILCTVLRPTGGSATLAGYDVVTQATQVRQQYRLSVRSTPPSTTG